MKFILSFLVINFVLLPEIFSQSIELFEKDATVWGREQEVTGKLNNFFSADVILKLNGSSITSSVNYPNPFNPSMSIKFNLPSPGHVSLKIYDMLGEETTVLVNGNLNPGSHTILFDGGNLSSGIYFYRFEFKNRIITRKMILLK